MKLRLDPQTADLCVRFDGSEGLCSNIFKSWLRAMAEYFKAFVFIPDLEVVLATTPDCFRQFKNLVGIIDCSEVFIERPKKLETSECNININIITLKFLVCVVPNSSIIYISECYTSRISSKALAKESGFLDELPSYSSIMADKRFNLFDESTARNIHFIIPPGRRGASQMTL